MDKGLGSGRELRRSKAGCIVVEVVVVEEEGLGRFRSASEAVTSEGSGTVIWSRSCVYVWIQIISCIISVHRRMFKKRVYTESMSYKIVFV